MPGRMPDRLWTIVYNLAEEFRRQNSEFMRNDIRLPKKASS